MNGFCGFINRPKIDSEDTIKAMINKLKHRGSSWKSYIDEFVSFACVASNKNLANPVFNEDKTIVAVSDGRIYNFQEIKDKLAGKHEFRSNKDVEAIIHAYEEKGISSLEVVNGEWGLCLWDRKKKKLFLAVDPFAIKRLYFFYDRKNLAFASELKSVMAYPTFEKKIDPLALQYYLIFGCIPTCASIFQNTRRVPQESYLKYDVHLNGVQIRPYCDFIRKQSNANISVNSVVDNLHTKLQKAVSRRLPKGEPIGLFLSGGIDSSSLLYVLKHLGYKDVDVFTLGFNPSEAGISSESAKARAYAKKMGVATHELVCSVEDLVSGLFDVSSYLDEPVSDVGVVGRYLLSRFAKNYVGIAFYGDGADELFGGYESYVADIIFHKYYFLNEAKWLSKLLMKLLSRMPDLSQSNVNPLFVAKEFLKGLSFDEYVRHFMFRSIFLLEELDTLLKPEYRSNESSIMKPILDQLTIINSKDFADRIIRLDILVSLQDYMIPTTVFASLAAQIEIREPYLDRELAEFALNLPVNLKIRNANPLELIREMFFCADTYQRKYIFKKAMENKIPKEVLHRPKVGFGIPSKSVIKKMKPVIYDLLDEKRLRKQGIFEMAPIKEILDRHFNRGIDERKKIWALLMFQLWYYSFYESDDKLLHDLKQLIE